MPLFKGKASKAKSQKAIDYVTNPQKAVIVTSQSLDDYRSYAKQFKETCDMYGKGKSANERKYYHFKLSFNPNDNPTPQQSHKLAEKLAQQLFPDHECVIATHDDTDTLHSHIIVNAVSFETGRKLHLNDKAYRDCKDLANTLGAEMGLSIIDWRTITKEKRERSKTGEAITSEGKYLSSAERNMSKNKELNTASWKEALRSAIDEAKAHTTDRTEFQRYLQEHFGVTMPRNTTKTVSFVHPAVGETYAIRGNKLGADYTAHAIDGALQQSEILQQNKNYNDRRVLDEGLFTTTQHHSAEYHATGASYTVPSTGEYTSTTTATAPTPTSQHHGLSQVSEIAKKEAENALLREALATSAQNSEALIQKLAKLQEDYNRKAWNHIEEMMGQFGILKECMMDFMDQTALQHQNHNQSTRKQLQNLQNMNQVFSQNLDNAVQATVDKITDSISIYAEEQLTGHQNVIEGIIEKYDEAAGNLAESINGGVKGLNKFAQALQKQIYESLKKYNSSVKDLFWLNDRRKKFFYAGIFGGIATPVVLILGWIGRGLMNIFS